MILEESKVKVEWGISEITYEEFTIRLDYQNFRAYVENTATKDTFIIPFDDRMIIKELLKKAIEYHESYY